MTISIRRAADYRRMPWKNGGGVTTEIARGGGSSDGDGFDWRISIADVAIDGPFSLFPGIQRTIAVIDGAGMDLLFADGEAHRLFPHQPFTFDGARAVESRLLLGPVRDLNVMVRHGAWFGNVHIHAGLAPFHLPAQPDVDARFAIVLNGRWQAATGETLAAEDNLFLAPEDAARLVPVAVGAVALITLQLLRKPAHGRGKQSGSGTDAQASAFRLAGVGERVSA